MKIKFKEFLKRYFRFLDHMWFTIMDNLTDLPSSIFTFLGLLLFIVAFCVGADTTQSVLGTALYVTGVIFKFLGTIGLICIGITIIATWVYIGHECCSHMVHKLNKWLHKD